MSRLLSTFVLAALLVTSAPASDETDVMSVVHQWVNASNKHDMKLFVALCSEQSTIMDDFPPYQWQGPGACSRWWGDNDTFSKANEITDAFVTLGEPLELYVTGDHAYVVTRDDFTYRMKGKLMKQTGSIHTVVLHKSSSGWLITGEAWASTALAAPVRTGS
jgi:ketosteroid isomerase-like protein